MAKESYAYEPKKEEARQKWRNFIIQNIRGNPKNWSVVCFPWGDEKRSYEIEEVYIPLGISRSNIIGIEREKEKYEKLKAMKLGIELFHGEARDFFENNEGKYDIINLDYLEQYNLDVRSTIACIAGKQRLKSKGAFSTNISGRRESKNIQDIYRWAVIPILHRLGISTDDIISTYLKLKNLSPYFSSYKEPEIFLKQLGFTSLEKIRDRGLVQTTIMTFLKGKDALRINPIYERDPDRNEVKLNAFFDKRDPSLLLPKLALNDDHFFDEASAESLAKYLVNKGYPYDLALLIIHGSAYPYYVESVESYKYVGNMGFPMLTDFFFFDQHRETIGKYDKFSDHVYIDLEDCPFTEKEVQKRLQKDEILEQIVKDYKRWKKVIDRDIDTIRKLYFKGLDENLKERLFLGSSARRQKLTGQKYYELRVQGTKEGKSIEELQKEILRNFNTTPNKVRAYEAHCTMETYGPMPERIEEQPAISEPEIVTETLTQKNTLRSMLNRDAYRKMSENAKLRMQYFVDDLYGLGMDDEQISKMLTNIKESKFYENGENPNDTRLYSFFDDLTLCARNGYIPEDKAIKSIYKSVLNCEIDPEVRKYIITPRKLTKYDVGKALLELFEKGATTVYSDDMVQPGENKAIVSMLMTNWAKEHPEKYAARKDKDGRTAIIKNPSGTQIRGSIDRHGCYNPP